MFSLYYINIPDTDPWKKDTDPWRRDNDELKKDTHDLQRRYGTSHGDPWGLLRRSGRDTDPWKKDSDPVKKDTDPWRRLLEKRLPHRRPH